MATFTNIQTTEAGQALLAEVHAGIEQLTITAIAFGSGIWTEEEYAARNLAALKNEVLRVVPSGGEQAGGVADITCVLTNAALETGFALTEIGVIAKKADESEVLYMVDSVEAAKSTWISPASEHLMQIPVELRIACSSKSEIEIRIESTAPVTTADMDRHNNAADAHPDIRQELEEHSALLGKLRPFYVGEFESFPFAPDELPEHWHFRNGELVDKTSPAGKRLLAMSANYKLRHGITETETHISLPNAFNENGDGYFDRPVDGVNRQVGNVQGDTIQNITGSLNIGSITGLAYPLAVHTAVGALKALDQGPSSYGQGGDSSGTTFRGIAFDASGFVPTSHENRPINYGSTPAVFLPPLEA